MGNPTGFMKVARQTSTELPPKERIANFNEFQYVAFLHVVRRFHRAAVGRDPLIVAGFVGHGAPLDKA